MACWKIANSRRDVNNYRFTADPIALRQPRLPRRIRLDHQEPAAGLPRDPLPLHVGVQTGDAGGGIDAGTTAGSESIFRADAKSQSKDKEEIHLQYYEQQKAAGSNPAAFSILS